MHVSASGSQSPTRSPIPSNDRTSHDINKDRAFVIARHATLEKYHARALHIFLEVFISSSLDGSLAIDPTLTRYQSFGAATSGPVQNGGASHASRACSADREGRRTDDRLACD